MTIQHHLDEATIVAFAAGAVAHPIAVVVSAHLSMCPRCRKHVRQAEALGSAALVNDDGVALSQGAINNLMERLDVEVRCSEPASEQPPVALENGCSVLPPQVHLSLIHI